MVIPTSHSRNPADYMLVIYVSEVYLFNRDRVEMSMAIRTCYANFTKVNPEQAGFDG